MLLNPHNPEVNGKRIVLYMGDLNSGISNENVINIRGKDTILFAKCIGSTKAYHYYKIMHHKGLAGFKLLTYTKKVLLNCQVK